MIGLGVTREPAIGGLSTRGAALLPASAADGRPVSGNPPFARGGVARYTGVMPRPHPTLPGPVEVMTCIGCGARTRIGECPAGCVDVPLDLVEVAALTQLRAAVEAREDRVAALREVADAVAGAGAGADWAVLKGRTADALRRPAPPADPAAVEVVPAWGCPDCGRVDAPRECIGVCVRVAVPMADAGGLHAVPEPDHPGAEDLRQG